MHIPDGVLSCSPGGMTALAIGLGAAAGGTILGLRKIDADRVPQVAVVSAALFVASSIHVPVGVQSVHLLLAGLAGLILGWAVFPATLIALVLQFVLFGHGGLTSLGVNTVVLALPGVVCYYLFRRGIRGRYETAALASGAAAGAVAVLLAAVLAAAALLAAGESFRAVASLAVLANVPVAVVEGLVTASAVGFVRKVRPELFDAPWLATAGGEVHRG
jgi:cobalt/nickel transport system permease protein